MSTPAEQQYGQGDDGSAEEAFAQCPMPAAIFDSALRVVRASRGMALEAGVTDDEVRTDRGVGALFGSAGAGVEQGILGVFETGEADQMDVRVYGAAGGPRVWSVTLSPLRDRARRVHRVQLTAVEVTELHRARDRLAVLNEVSVRVGTTLDVSTTAQEMADLMVGRLADFVTVDLVDSQFRGLEPKPSAEGVVLRRAAHQSVLPGVPEALIEPGEIDHYPDYSPPARCLVTGQSSLHNLPDAAVTSWQAVDPQRAAVLHARGIHSVMVVPLRARGIVLGISLLVRHQNPVPFGLDDLLLAEEIAARAAVAVDNARLYTRERSTALALQRSLLPQRLTGQDTVQAVFRYLPADSRAGIGGDWFDVIPLSGARVALVVGDVAGHGLHASATMGRLRTAVRALTDVDLPPDELLTHLDDLVAHLAATEDEVIDPDLDTISDIVATCLYLVYDPVAGSCTVASAGHLPPAVVGPDGAVDIVDLSPGPPLGVGGLPFEATRFAVAEGTLLVLYTDGLIEACGRDIDTGLDLLRRSLERPPASLEKTCAAVVDTMLPAPPTDDVALLIARTRILGPSHVATWDVPSDPAMVAQARAWSARQLAEWGLQEATFALELVVSELVTNAIRHGAPPIRLRLIRDTAIICEVSDGSNTSPHLRQATTFDEGGRGLLLVAQVAQRWGARHHAVGKTIWAEIALHGGDFL
ncbi:serine phosphatase RsbU (regulator of sigma subunit)/anti-sigma regulatory factor (Ser/Thr protein kinase) [Catenulispora sp. GP43]|uniref:SpoIIE family protein phosphatase n=1 Tax=Catenulispora sp. GP43 TaxID=3156263 RepID=UPI0035137546